MPQPFSWSFFPCFFMPHSKSIEDGFRVRKPNNLGFTTWQVSKIDKVDNVHVARSVGKPWWLGNALESCTSRAALEIKRLRAKLEKTRYKPGSRNNPGRQYRKKGYTKEKARQEYTKKNVRKTYCKKRQNDSVAGWAQFRKRLQKSVSDPMMAYEKLKEFGFLHEPRRCLACGCESLCPPVGNSASDVLSVYVQCGRRACRCKSNVVSYGVFRGLRLNCCDLLRAVKTTVAKRTCVLHTQPLWSYQPR
jgi:hypothetical protein